ncbi:MAG: hypothetical protein QOD69_3569, partial [Solirubrobacteraceae bacterium]|nr:hypothetical protein [Solirubrobacteraceae bacterium]
AYSRRAARVFDPLAERAARRALTLAGEQRPQGDVLAPGAASGPQVPIR